MRRALRAAKRLCDFDAPSPGVAFEQQRASGSSRQQRRGGPIGDGRHRRAAVAGRAPGHPLRGTSCAPPHSRSRPGRPATNADRPAAADGCLIIGGAASPLPAVAAPPRLAAHRPRVRARCKPRGEIRRCPRIWSARNSPFARRTPPPSKARQRFALSVPPSAASISREIHRAGGGPVVSEPLANKRSVRVDASSSFTSMSPRKASVAGPTRTVTVPL